MPTTQHSPSTPQTPPITKLKTEPPVQKEKPVAGGGGENIGDVVSGSKLAVSESSGHRRHSSSGVDVESHRHRVGSNTSGTTASVMDGAVSTSMPDTSTSLVTSHHSHHRRHSSGGGGAGGEGTVEEGW